jgi:hypothetical protein
MLVTWSELPRSPGRVFYDRLQAILIATEFDSFVEELCASHCAVVRGRPSLSPGRYFRMLLIGYFEGIDSERGRILDELLGVTNQGSRQWRPQRE